MWISILATIYIFNGMFAISDKLIRMPPLLKWLAVGFSIKYISLDYVCAHLLKINVIEK